MDTNSILIPMGSDVLSYTLEFSSRLELEQCLAQEFLSAAISQRPRNYLSCFCLRPSAKDQGITWVVVVVLVLVVLVLVLLHLVHFLIKRNLRENKTPQPGIEPGTSRSTAQHLSTERKWHCYFCVWKLSTYFKNHAADLGPTLVNTCCICFPLKDIPIRA